jgi:DNA-binding response OmpR family regulator
MKVLLIDDEEESYLLVSKALGRVCQLVWTKNLAESWEKCQAECFDLILLDVTLPDGDGFQFCARLQSEDRTRNTPVILLTGETGVANRVLGFSLGADDYIEKPFDPIEFRARIESKLKKLRLHNDAESILRCGDLYVDVLKQRATVSYEGKSEELNLTPIEFKLLHYLIRHPEQTFSRDQLMTAVWGENTNVVDRTVDKHISSLRHKLFHCIDYVQTVAGFGYRLCVPEKMRKSA